MALLGIVKKFKASHGTKTIKTCEYKVEITLEGKIINGLIQGIDYDAPKKELEKVLSSLEGQYLDDIVGRATNENVAQYILYQLREILPHSLIIYEGGQQYAVICLSDMNFNDYPAQLHFNKAQSLLFREKPELAIKELNDAIELKGNFAEAYNLRGRCEKYMSRYDLALLDYLQTIEINPNFGEAYRNVGNAYYHLGKLDLMIPAFTRAIELMPNSALAYNNRGFAYQRLGKFELALADHNKSIELDQNYAEAYRDRAIAYESLGEKELADKDYVRAKYLSELGKDTFAGIKMYG